MTYLRNRFFLTCAFRDLILEKNQGKKVSEIPLFSQYSGFAMSTVFGKKIFFRFFQKPIEIFLLIVYLKNEKKLKI